MSAGPLPALLGLFGELSLLAFGGGAAILPEMERQVVAVHHWMTERQFAALFALAQAAPGPNMLVSTLIGWRVDRLSGAVVATLGMVGPSSLLTYATSRLWQRFRDAPWRGRLQAGMTPVAVGLIAAGALLVAASTTTGIATALVTAAVTLAVLRTRINPLWFLAAAALLGATGALEW